jgi:hypothetical protein
VNKKAIDKSLDCNKLERIFSIALSSKLIGETNEIEIHGSQQELDAIVESYNASKDFDNELNNPDSTIETVMSKLGAKHISATKFEKVLGFPWPL